MTTMSNSNASCFRVGLSWVELRWVLTIGFIPTSLFQFSSVMTCLLACQHMTPSTAIEGSKTFSLALSQKSLAKQCVRIVHSWNSPHKAFKVYLFDHGAELPKILGGATCSGSTHGWNPPHSMCSGSTL